MFNSLLLAVAIVAQSPGYYTSLANHIKRWLASEGISSSLVTPEAMEDKFRREKTAILIGFEKPTQSQLRVFSNFKAKRGRFIVFYSSSKALADLMDVNVLGFKSAPYAGAWSRMDFVSRVPEGLPSAIRQTSSVLLRAAPKPGKGRVLATWTDRKGRPAGETAWIATSGGYWMTHVLTADGDENLKARLLGALVGSLESGKWSLGTHLERERAKKKEMLEYASRQSPRRGEIHAVWDHSGCGLYPGNWPKTIALLKKANITDLFVNVAGAGFAHYASNVLPRSKTFTQEGDQLSQCLAAARGSGVRVHAWVLCFTASRSTPARLEEFKRKGWRVKSQSGKLTEYLNPSLPEVRSYMLRAIEEIVNNYAVSGVHLDFIRWGDYSVKSANAASYPTRFVADVRRKVARPKWLTAAVYGAYPQCVSTVGQDWPSWIDTNIVDYVVPMNYTDSNLKFTELLVQQAATKTRASRTIVGIGVTANESRLDARKTIDQIKLTRRLGFAGNALFDLDVTLEKSILPYLSLGVWK